MLGQIQGVGVVIIVDIESTHNFVDPFIKYKVWLPVYHMAGLSVKEANGEALHNDGITKQVLCHMQGINFDTNFYVLTLGGCDVVLGELVENIGVNIMGFLLAFNGFLIKGQPHYSSRTYTYYINTSGGNKIPTGFKD